MLKQYFIIGWRSLRKQKLFSLINILGLAAGIAFSLLIAAYVREELSVNSGLKNVGQLYKVESKWKTESMGLPLTSVGPLAREMKRQFPDLVKNYYRWDGVTSTVSKGDKAFREGLQIGDSTFLQMFGFNLIQGNISTALREPFSLVISENMARKYFGRTDIIGETLNIESFNGTRRDFQITGVLAKPVRNSVTEVNSSNDNQFYIPLNTLSFFNRDIERWNNQYVVQYLELQPGTSPALAEKAMKQLVTANTISDISSNLTPYLVPMSDYYLVMENGLVQKMIYTLSAIALFILGMAIINFVNLSISQAGRRMREIGVRKTLGGKKSQLIGQFLTESVLIVLLATVVALGLYILARPMFNSILGKNIPSLFVFPVSYLAIPVMFALVVGLIAGIYPAFVLGGLNSINSLKGKLGTVGENRWLRRSLIGFQFCLAAIVFSSAIIISRQIELFFGKDLGYDKEFVVSAQLPRDWSAAGVEKVERIRDRFARLPQVAGASVSYEIPNGNNLNTVQMRQPGTDSVNAISVTTLSTDQYYADTYKLPLVAGKFFETPYNASDIVINEKAVAAFGWKDAADAIGRKLTVNQGSGDLIIKGVVRDFHFASMQQPIEPSVFMNVRMIQVYRFLSLKIQPGNTAASLAALQKEWSAALPGTPFEYTFMDDTLKKIYTNEIRLKQAAGLASGLAILIALLGVVGLVSLNIQKRVKEIGIRKIVGASVSSIIRLFLKDFLLIITAGALLACPIAWLIMDQWLADYAYRIRISASPFVTASLALGIITSLLIVLQTMKAATANPVNSLRSE
ncbi:MAG: ABC transporter permease [Chitinophagaceae bacterium]